MSATADQLIRDYLSFGNHAATEYSHHGSDAAANAVRAAVTVVTVLTELRQIDPEAADRATQRVYQILGTDQSAYDALYTWTTDVINGEDLTMPTPTSNATDPGKPVHPWEQPTTGHQVPTVAADSTPQPDPNPTPAPINDPEVVHALNALHRTDPTTAARFHTRYTDTGDTFGRNELLAFAHHRFANPKGEHQ